MFFLFAAAGLSGNSVRGAVDNGANALDPSAASNIVSSSQNIEETVKSAAEYALKAMDLTVQTFSHGVSEASNKIFESAAEGHMAAQSLSQSSFSWGNYFQAIGILCFLLAALWFAVWLIRRYGKFNFLPRPGSLPKDALIMEAQMPLGPKKGLMVVRFLNRRLLLGVTERQITLLTEEKVSNERQNNDFQSIIDKAGAANAHSGIDRPAS